MARKLYFQGIDQTGTPLCSFKRETAADEIYINVLDLRNALSLLSEEEFEYWNVLRIITESNDNEV